MKLVFFFFFKWRLRNKLRKMASISNRYHIAIGKDYESTSITCIKLLLSNRYLFNSMLCIVHIDEWTISPLTIERTQMAPFQSIPSKYTYNSFFWGMWNGVQRNFHLVNAQIKLNLQNPIDLGNIHKPETKIHSLCLTTFFVSICSCFFFSILFGLFA